MADDPGSSGAALGKPRAKGHKYARIAIARLESPLIKSMRRAAGWAAGLTVASWPAIAAAQDSLADPQGSGVIVSAVRWLQGTLLGTIATVVAVIAVAAVGLMMLTGRINWRYGAVVILGTFILFGAASIVAGIQATATLGR
jgi:type IV secretion system protein VirB2